MMIKRYTDEAFRIFQKEAISEKGSDFQELILQNAIDKEGKDFVGWLDNKIQEISKVNDITIDGDEPQLPNIPTRYTASDFKTPTKEAAENIWHTWEKIHPGILSSSTVWGYITSCLIKQEKIKPYYLMMGNNGANSDGKKEIEKALAAKGEARSSAIDACVRSFLRRFSGLQIVRGTRSVYQDCPIAMTWWQYYIANDAAINIGESGVQKDKQQVIDFLRQPSVWVIFSDKMASQLTVIGDRNIRDGLIVYFLNETDEDNRVMNKDNILKAVGVVCAWRALGALSPKEVSEIIKNDIVPYL